MVHGFICDANPLPGAGPPFDRVLGPLCHPPNQSPAWWDRLVPGPSGAAKRARWRDGLWQLRRRGSSRPGQGPGSQSPEGLVGVRGLRAPGWVSWCHQGGKAVLAHPAPRGDVFLLQDYILVLRST